MELFLEVLHVYIKNLILFLVIMVTIFEWFKTNSYDELSISIHCC